MYWIGPYRSTCIVEDRYYHINIDREQVTNVCLCPNKREPKTSTVQKNNKTKNLYLSINMYAHHIMFTQ